VENTATTAQIVATAEASRRRLFLLLSLLNASTGFLVLAEIGHSEIQSRPLT